MPVRDHGAIAFGRTCGGQDTPVASLDRCESGQLCIQIRQGFRENSPVARILCGTQFPHHSGAGEKDSFLLADCFQCFRTRRFSSYRCAAGLGHVDLRLDRLTFPTSGHDSIVVLRAAHGKRLRNSRADSLGEGAAACGALSSWLSS